MESTIILSIAAFVGFAVYYEMIGPTFLDYASNTGIAVGAFNFRACRP